MNCAETIFWVSIALLSYTFLLFPLLLWIRAKLFPRPVRIREFTPSVTLEVVAHNEADVMHQRLRNILSLDYPRELLNVLIVSDGSDDGTNEIVSEYADDRVALLALPRVGKIAALNAGMAQAAGDIVVFSDANTMCAADSLRVLLRPFADPMVGGVAGNQRYIEAGTANASAAGECAYWSFDQLLKEWQTAAGSITTSTGALYAIRRSLFRPVPASVADDAVISFRVVASGYRLVYEPQATAVEPVAPNPKAEWRRKVRVIALGMKSVLAVPELLNPAGYGFFSVQLFSHKILRWLAVWPMMSLFVSSLLLAGNSTFYATVFLAQSCFYAGALSVWLATLVFPTAQTFPRAVTLPYFFCLTYAASLRAQWMVLTRKPIDRWNVVRDRSEAAVAEQPQRESVAYIMSRFPKMTETFVLYEILELERGGEPVGIYPLIRQRERVEHPEVAAAITRAHYKPFLSFSILRANLHFLSREPAVYVRTLVGALRGTFGSMNFFAGAVLFFPKSVAFAFEMQRNGVRHVHAHFATHPALSALVIHRLASIPYSFTAHGHDVHCDRRMLPEKLAAASFAVAISDYNRKLIAEECGHQHLQKIHVVHCGVDTSYFENSRPVRRNGPLRIITVASFWEVKGHAYLIQACRLLRDRGIRFQSDFVGDGELRADLERQIAASGLDDAFTFHGPQPRNVVRAMLYRSDVKVLPSVLTSNGLREGIPVALMEAMACGLPVVSSVLSGIPELVDNGISGILVPPRDIVALADALEQMARNPELRERMGSAGREKVLKEFDLRTNARTLADLFSKQRKPELEEESPIAA